MSFARKIDGGWVELPVGEPVAHDDVVAAYETVTRWSDNERAAWGIYAIGPGETPPDGQRIASATIGDKKGRPVWVNVFEPIPVDPYAHFVPIPMLRQRLEKLGLFDDFAAYLAQYPTQMMRVLSLERGVDPTYLDLLTAFDMMDVPQSARDYLMADPSVGVPDA